MSDAYLLDTNAVTAIVKGDTILESLIADRKLFIPIIVVGELYYGIENSQRREENQRRYEGFVAGREILYCDLDTARIFGLVQAKLKVKGRPVQHNDMWIAALAIQYNLPVITRDSDFQSIAGITVIGW